MLEFVSNLIEKVRLFGIEKVFGRYYSLYRAQVIDNQDPLRRGRIKVKIPTIAGDNEWPNWVIPADSRATGLGYGEFYPPELEDWVFVQFLEGDTRNPVYTGGYFANDELHEDFAHDEANTPNVRGYRDPLGSKILFDQSLDKRKVTIKVTDGSEEELGHEIILDATKDAEMVSVTTKSGHYFVLDDTKDNEGLYLAHKIGSQIQIDKAGSIKVFSVDGNYMQLNAEEGTVVLGSKDGSVVALKDNIVLSEATGKTLATISKDGIQLTSDKDVIVQSKSATVKSGSISLDGGNAKMNLGSAKVAIGTPACEIVDTLIQIIDALLNDTALVTTGVGPSSGLIGTAKVQLTLLKVKLNLIKGVL